MYLALKSCTPHHEIARQKRGANPRPISERTVVDIDVNVGSAISTGELAERMDEPYAGKARHGTASVFPKTDWDREIGGKIASVGFSDADELYHNSVRGSASTSPSRTR